MVRARRFAAFCVALSLSASLVSCGAPRLGLPGRRQVLFLADRPWWDAAGGDAALRRPLALAALRRWLVPRFEEVPLQEDARLRLESRLASGAWKAVVVGPLMAPGAAEIAPRYREVTFILVGGPAVDDGISNTISLAFDRRQAFAEAGAEAARAGPVGVVASAARPSTPELEAFVDAAWQASGVEPVIESLSEPADATRMQEAVQAMRVRGVKLFLPWLASGGSAFLEVLRQLGGAAVVEDWAASGVLPEQVFLSIDEDLVGGIARCLASLASPVPVVQGPVLLTRGRATGEPGGPP